jgi:hypothetical protein
MHSSYDNSLTIENSSAVINIMRSNAMAEPSQGWCEIVTSTFAEKQSLALSR